MNDFWNRVLAYFWLPETKYVLLAFALLAVVALRLLPNERRRIRNTILFFLICLAGQFVGALLEAFNYSRLAVMVHEAFVIGSGFALFRLCGHVVFRIVLPRVGIVVARIAEDILLLVVYAAFILARLHLVGLDPGVASTVGERPVG